MAASPTVTELVQHYHIEEELLNNECSEANLSSFVSRGRFIWGEWAQLLGLTDQQINDLKGDTTLDERGKGKKTLEKWHNRCGFMATYRRLVELFLKEGYASLAQNVCEILRDAPQQRSTVDSTKLEASQQRTTVDSTKPECSKCISLQTDLLMELRKQLKMFKSLNWSEKMTSTAMEQAIREYVEKFIKAGCRDRDHPLEHLNDLYHHELLITDHSLLTMAREIAMKAFSPLNTPFRSTDSPVTTKAPPVSPHISDDQTEPLLSEPFLYHASVCSQIVSEYTYESYHKFFDGKDTQIGHSFEELSMSRLNEGRYLIAKQIRQNTCIYYIAFQGESLCRWPDNYSDIADGISRQRDKFPVRFIAELLRKEKRVILTGFSIGGLLACSLLAGVWCLPNLKPQLIEKNLACITFAQPHLPVPRLESRAYFYPRIAKSIHVVLFEGDVVPRLTGVLCEMPKYEKDFTQLCEAIQPLLQKGSCKVPSELVTDMQGVCAKGELAKAVPSINQPMTYHLLHNDGTEFVCQELSKGELPEHSSYKLQNFSSSSIHLDIHSMSEYLGMINTYVQKDDKYEIPSKFSKPPLLSELKAQVTMIELHRHGSELALALEGHNLWFYSKLIIYKDKCIQDGITKQIVSGTSVQVNFNAENNPNLRDLGKQRNPPVKVPVKVETYFDPHWEIEVEIITKEYAMSKRQQQLAKLTPSEVIEMSYLCALLEKQPYNNIQPLQAKISPKMEAIRMFLERVVKVVPLESLGYCVAFADSYIRQQCANALKMKLRNLQPSEMMIDALTRAKKECTQCSLLDSAKEPETGLPEHVTPKPSGNCLCSLLTQLLDQMGRIDEATQVICDLNIELLYPVSEDSKSTAEQDLKSPTETLRIGRDKLSSLSTRNKANHEMLQVVNDIRSQELAVCVSLLGSFMDQQEINVPLTKASIEAENVAAEASIGVWALSSLSLEHVQELLKDTRSKELVVDIDDYMLSVRDTSKERHQKREESQYASKLRFIVQGLHKTVTCNSQYISYSLERQLSDRCKGKPFTTSSLEEITEDWDTLFKGNTLSLVARSHRPMIARWLRWALMIHDLREELAKYITVGVVGLVNAGKSTLLNRLFQLDIPSGTTEEKRTTIPFIYNVSDKVEGLDVVDFPGVDDRDKSIPDLATLLLTLAQIIIFVVDYRKIHTESSEKWLERLRAEKVPVLVCMTYADKLYAEHMKNGEHPNESFMKREIKSQLTTIKEKLQLPPSYNVRFFYFNLDEDSVLNGDKGRQILRDVGIDSPSDVGDWLVETFKKSFLEERMAQRLKDHFETCLYAPHSSIP